MVKGLDCLGCGRELAAYTGGRRSRRTVLREHGMCMLNTFPHIVPVRVTRARGGVTIRPEGRRDSVSG